MWLRFNPGGDALFLDIDGTLLDIAPAARCVIVPPDLVENLARLFALLEGAFAFISGRTISDIDGLFAPLKLPCSGVHGSEWRLSAKGRIHSLKPLPQDLRRALASSLAGQKGVQVEDKGFSLAVHYRSAPEQADAIEETLRAILRKREEPLALIPGRKVMEITRASHNKGQAIERFMETPVFKNRRPVFLGDDVTDLTAIGACMKHGGIAARVGHGSSGPKTAFASPAKVRAWIGQIVKQPDR